MTVFRLFWYELKRAFRVIITSFAGLLAAAILLTGVYFCVMKAMSDNDPAIVSVGIVNEEDPILNNVLSMIETLDAVKYVCRLEYLDKEQGRKQLEDGKLAALLIFPKDFVRRVDIGENPQVEIMLPDSGGIMERYVERLLILACDYIRTAEAGVYTAYQHASVYGVNENIGHLGDYIARKYATNWLGRNRYFTETTVLPYGDMDRKDFLGVLFSGVGVLTVGMFFFYMYEKQEDAVGQVLSQKGITPFVRNIIKYIILIIFLEAVGLAMAAMMGGFAVRIMLISLMIATVIHSAFVCKSRIGGNVYPWVATLIIILLCVLGRSSSIKGYDSQLTTGYYAADGTGAMAYIEEVSKLNPEIEFVRYDSPAALKKAVGEGSIQNGILCDEEFNQNLEDRSWAFEIVSSPYSPGTFVIREAIYSKVFRDECQNILTDGMLFEQKNIDIDRLHSDYTQMLDSEFVFKPAVIRVATAGNIIKKDYDQIISVMAIAILYVIASSIIALRFYSPWWRAVELVKRSRFKLRLLQLWRSAFLIGFISVAAVGWLCHKHAISYSTIMTGFALVTSAELVLFTMLIRKKDRAVGLIAGNTAFLVMLLFLFIRL